MQASSKNAFRLTSFLISLIAAMATAVCRQLAIALSIVGGWITMEAVIANSSRDPGKYHQRNNLQKRCSGKRHAEQQW
jgi:hypothetical protein